MRPRSAWLGLAVVVLLMVSAMVVPAALDWNVHVFSFPPIHAEWQPRVGPGTPTALALGVVGMLYAVQAAERWPWRRLLLASYLMAVAWLASLALVDGSAGIGDILGTEYEYLRTAHQTTDVSAMLHEYVSRIPLSSPSNWPVHIAGHSPGALLFFVALVRLGLGGGLAAGWVVLLVAATTPVAVLVALRRLGAELMARRAAPFLVLGPAALWMAVSADAMFGAVAAWGLCCLAIAATEQSRVRLTGWSIAAGLLLGYCVMLSYGLPLLAVLAVGVLVVARTWRPLPWAAGAALAVVLAFAAAGFSWWDAYPVLRQRYWDGVASRRPMRYWVWGDLAALCFSAGPLLGPSVASAGSRARAALRRARSLAPGGRTGSSTVDGSDRPIVWLCLCASACILVADLSGMSKAEVERIWLPFVPWLLLGCSLLPARWRRLGLAGQVVFALVLQHLFFTGW
ncbi:MAG: hypothetical protein ACR2LE_03670 [Nocardioidaceae bacterium]